MAAPHVAGAVAMLHSVASPAFELLRASDPAAAALEVKDALLANVDVIPALNGITVSDGRLNLFQAASALEGWSDAGSIVPYGTGLGGANVGTLDSASTPTQGTTITLDVGGFASSGVAVIKISSFELDLPILGGRLLIGLPDLASVGTVLTAGAASVPLPLPDGLAGQVLYLQAGALDATQSHGVALSNGLRIAVGS
jgi:hypothetical protein